MGGYGSGRHSGKSTADASLRIDLAWMLRSGYAVPGQARHGTLHWSCNGHPSGSISYTAIMDEAGAERLELSYTRGGGDQKEHVRQTVRLTFTQPNYGGKRWWMICPYHGVRVAKLYKPGNGDRFASRKAWRLGYHIQRVAHRDRPLEALFALQKKLGCKQGVDNWPTRPKGMWHRTYARHMARYEKLDALCAAEMAAMMARLNGDRDVSRR